MSGGVTQEAEFAAVKFVSSPYTLSLVSTPPFIRPRLPYNIQVTGPGVSPVSRHLLLLTHRCGCYQ